MSEKPDTVIGKVLSTTVVVEEHLTKALPAMLAAAGVTPDFQEAVGEFLKPVVALLGEMERDVIAYTRGQALAADAFDGQAAQLEAWADTFSRLANTPQQMRAARGFSEFVSEMTRMNGKEAEKGKEPRAKDIERE